MCAVECCRLRVESCCCDDRSPAISEAADKAAFGFREFVVADDCGAFAAEKNRATGNFARR